MTEDDELEGRVRASLDAHAAEVDTSVPVAARARAAARRHRGRWVAAGAAAAVAAVAATAVVVDRGDAPGSEEPPVAGPPSSAPVVPAGWRVEYWHDVSVQVPADWGWGTAPTTVMRGDLTTYLCGGPGAMRTTRGKNLVNPVSTAPYVGRPIMLSDACMGGVRSLDPQAPYVWLGADLPPGTADVGNGYTQETVEAAGTTVTVGAVDAALRERILSSVARQDLCPPTVPSGGPDPRGTLVEGVGEVRTFDLCAYAAPDRGGPLDLVYAADLGAGAYADWRRALTASEDVGVSGGCADHGELVVLTGTFDDPAGTEPVSQGWTVDVPCDLVYADDGSDAVLTPELRAAWHAPALRSILRTYIGMLG
ncbi:hypothetical protein [Nocardioides conyzicola]|uniref:Uncharacterized protein n=1 Tax=Nocardioides conyzicola TaxID=1651781 RepID=A0ABP8WUZ3_9ACTN